MKKTIKALTIVISVLAGIWLIGELTFFLCYEYLPAFKDYVIVEYAFSIAMTLLIFLVIGGFAISFKRQRDSGELQAASILGNDIKEAYTFGQLGMLVTDDDGTILWYNEYLDNNGFRVIDEPLTAISASLKELADSVDDEKTVRVKYTNRIYQVKLIKEANLYIFKDVTSYDSLQEVHLNAAPVFGYLQVDNYSDLSNASEETTFAGLIGNLKKMLNEFAAAHNIYVRAVKADTFLLLTGFSDYKKMADENFKIIDLVREAFNGELTLSAGFSYGYPNFTKLAQSANESLNVALSRGGDQVAISPFGENMIFIGGKTESKGAFSRVKIRLLSQSFITTIENASNVLVIGHYMADFDAIGACLGVLAICDTLSIPCKIVYDGQNVETNCRRAFTKTFPPSEIKRMTVNYNEAIDLINEKTLVVAVDINSPDRLLYQNFIPDDSDTKVAIIDHHRRSAQFFKNVVFNGIDSSASSACELVASYIQAATIRILLPKEYATFMLTGTMVDTDSFRYKVSPATFEAMAVLKSFGADSDKADEFIKEDYEQFQMKVKLLNSATTPFTGILVAINPDDNELLDRTLLAIVSQQAMSISGFDAAFTIGRISESEIGISARSTGEVNVETIMRKMGGGGHFSSAATIMPGTNVKKAREKLVQVLADYLPDAKAKKRSGTTITGDETLGLTNAQTNSNSSKKGNNK